MTANLYQRHLLNETMEAYYPNAVIPVPDIIEHKERPFDPTYAESKTLTMTVPPVGALGTCTAWMSIIPSGPPTKSAYFSVLRVSDSQAFTVTSAEGALTEYQVRVYPGRPFIDFHADRAGDIVKITYTAGWTQLTGDLIRRLFVELNAVETQLNVVQSSSGLGNNLLTVTANGDIAKGKFCDVYLDGSTLKCQTTTGQPFGYATAAIPNGNVGTLTTWGLVTTFSAAGDFRVGTPSAGAYLFASLDTLGAHTWMGDSDAAYNLDANENHTVIGRFIGGNNALILCNNHARFNQGS